MNKRPPFFSIIIPTFNSSSTIKSCLNSLLCQDFQDFEIIIIDSCSNDDTLKLISDFTSQKIKVISEKDNGIYDAMNKGLSIANGEWVYFLGSDDSLFSSNVLSKVKNHVKDDSKVLYGNVKINGDVFWAKNNFIYAGPFNLKKVLKKNICHQAIFYHRQTILDNNLTYETAYKVCADWHFNLQLWIINEFSYMNLIVANFGVDGFSSKEVSGDLFENALFDFRKIYGRKRLSLISVCVYCKNLLNFYLLLLFYRLLK